MVNERWKTWSKQRLVEAGISQNWAPLPISVNALEGELQCEFYQFPEVLVAYFFGCIFFDLNLASLSRSTGLGFCPESRAHRC